MMKNREIAFKPDKGKRSQQFLTHIYRTQPNSYKDRLANHLRCWPIFNSAHAKASLLSTDNLCGTRASDQTPEVASHHTLQLLSIEITHIGGLDVKEDSEGSFKALKT